MRTRINGPIFVRIIITSMNKMTDILKTYLANSSNEQQAKDLEVLKEFNEFCVDVESFFMRK